MATAFYTSAKTDLLQGALNLTDGKLFCAAMSSGYSVNDANTLWSDVSANVVGTPVAATEAAASGGKLTAKFPDFTDVPSGSVITALVFYYAGASSVLVAYDTSALNLPFTADGSNISISYTNDLVAEIS